MLDDREDNDVCFCVMIVSAKSMQLAFQIYSHFYQFRFETELRRLIVSYKKELTSDDLLFCALEGLSC